MKRRKVCIIITTRGNYAKMKSLMKAIDASDDLELQLVVGGGVILPRYGLAMDSLDTNKYRIDRRIHFMVEGENPVAMAKSAGLAIIDFSTAFENLGPDFVVVIADRFECLSIAMASSYMNIPLVHVEGGEVSGSIDESVRHAITKLAHLHFPATEVAARRIERMGEDPRTIFPVGCTSLDAIGELDLTNIEPLMELQQRSGVGSGIDLREPYLVVIQHPVTTEYEENLAHVNETIGAINELSMNTVWIWPNMDAGSDGVSKGIRMFRERQRPDYVHFFKSLPIEYFAPLMKNAACIVGNSSSGIREATFLGVPVVNIGTRQQGRERGMNVIDVGYDREAIAEGIRRQINQGPYKPDMLYGDGKACQKIVEVLGTFEFNIQKKISY